MKALVYYGNKDIRLVDDWPEPQPGPGEVKLRVTYSSICATDIEEWQYGPTYIPHPDPNPLTGRGIPLVMGHEAAGRVAQLGEGVANLSVGDRVAVQDAMICGACYWCRRGTPAVCPDLAVSGLSADGGLAEFMVWPAELCIPLPENVSDAEAALVEPTTVALHAVRRSEAGLGDRVAVLGCGTVGLLAMQTLKAAGATVYAIDRRQQSLDAARRLGADVVIDAARDDPGARLLELTAGIGPDIVLETAGAAETPINAIDWVRRRGRVVLVGIYAARPRFNFLEIVGKGIDVVGSIAADPQDFRTAVALIASGKVNVRPLISAKVPLERAIQDGFERMLAPEKDVFRILVGPGA